eukprot:964440-Prorocentrum_minimum.AAC.3
MASIGVSIPSSASTRSTLPPEAFVTDMLSMSSWGSGAGEQTLDGGETLEGGLQLDPVADA